MARVTCEVCGQTYDDLYRLTICPHDEFGMQTTAVRQGADGKPIERVCTSMEELRAFERGELPGEPAPKPYVEARPCFRGDGIGKWVPVLLVYPAAFVDPNKEHGSRVELSLVHCDACKGTTSIDGGQAFIGSLPSKFWESVTQGFKLVGKVPPDRFRTELDWRGVES